ncbi:serine hydrolase domain-containing protein [Jiangella alba]|uniref:CubicO group peptidase, beta-lactamase class C family n=1 Tax=Jiangella alba TaxID=561176 RepID=A0A1H5L791_9ACTN|nr:serine hydrolase domain-containing protein [Jiangella alba]SEE72437.1 CubicO group peptidase, beta-lactamase class C family [Jiangella alba]
MPQIDELIAHLTDVVPREAAARKIPGVAIGLCDADGVLWSAGFGSTRAGTAPPPARAVGVHTMFSVQSTSKLYTATGVLLAVQEGLVDLDEPILRHLPEFTVRSDHEDHPERRITLRHLLTHTAGFTHEASVGSNYEVGDATFEEHLSTIPQTYLRFPVGHHHEYSNLGIDLAGHIAAKAGGETFPDFMRRRLFDPLGLTRSTFDFDVFDADADRAFGHSRTFARAGRELPRRVPMVPSGGLYTSVDDVLRYLRFQLRDGEDVLRPELIRQHLDFPRLTDLQTQGYGLGLYIDRWAPGVRVLHHGGAGFGFLCQVFWLPDAGIGGAVLTNAVDHDVQNELAADIVRRLAAGDRSAVTAPAPAPPPAAAPAPPPRVDELAGRYVGRLGDVVELVVRDGGLVQVEPEKAVVDLDGELTGTVPGEDPGGRRRLIFLRDAAGHVRYLLDAGTGDVRYRTVVPELGPSALPPHLLGDYTSRIADVPIAPYRLRQDDGRAVIDLPRRGSLADPITLQLSAAGPDRYVSATGEVLTAGEAGVAYAEIPLTRPDQR